MAEPTDLLMLDFSILINSMLHRRCIVDFYLLPYCFSAVPSARYHSLLAVDVCHNHLQL